MGGLLLRGVESGYKGGEELAAGEPDLEKLRCE